MIYTSLRCVLKISLSLIKIRSHLFGKPVLVCRTLEKASTLVQLRVCFKAQRKKKRKENTWKKTPKTCFLENKLCWNYFAEMYLMKYLLGLKLINTSKRVAYFTKIAGKRRRLVQQQTNKSQLSMSYQQQNVRSRRIASKTIAIRLYQGSRGRRILRPGTHKSWSGLLKISKAESAGRMFFSRGTATNYDRIIWLKSKVRHVLFVPSVAS